ncbi:hypothetical protein SPURM210S_02143 [Streptomyces purpurascens]
MTATSPLARTPDAGRAALRRRGRRACDDASGDPVLGRGDRGGPARGIEAAGAPAAGPQPPAARRVAAPTSAPTAAATAASTATLVRAAGRVNQSAMKPIAGGPRSMPP